MLSGVASDNAYEFTGRENDRTGLFYYPARYYHPGVARFVNEDPLYRLAGLWCSSLPTGSQRFNFYSYVENNPINFSDPLGLDKKNCLGNYFKCLPDCAILPGLTTAITTGGGVMADYYAAKAFLYAASKNLLYPSKSSVFRELANFATKANPISLLIGLNYCVYSCLYDEMKCVGLL